MREKFRTPEYIAAQQKAWREKNKAKIKKQFAEANVEQTFNTRLKRALRQSGETDPELIKIIKSIKYQQPRTEEQQDALNRILKIGKYRTWVLDPKRLEEIEIEENARWKGYHAHRKVSKPGRPKLEDDNDDNDDMDDYEKHLKELYG
jgi:hypothetical protein